MYRFGLRGWLSFLIGVGACAIKCKWIGWEQAKRCVMNNSARYSVLTYDFQVNNQNRWWIRIDLALELTLVTFVRILNMQLPIVRFLKL